MTIPNLLSLLRLALVPVFALVYFSCAPNAHLWSAVLYLAAFVTDVADGWIARRFNQITRLGRILDPMADKLMTFIVILCLTADGVIPVWAVVIFFCKELAMAIGGYLMYRARGGRDLLQLAGQERHRRVLRGVRRSGPFPRYSKALGRADDLRGPRPDGSRLFQLSVPICQGIGKKKIPLIHTQFIISD